MRKHSDPHPFNVELDLPIQALVYTLVVSLLFLYYFLHEAFGLPSFTDSLAIMAGTFMGEGTRERLKLVLGTDNSAVNPMGVVARARARANSLLSGGVAGGFRCDGEQLVGGLWNTGNTCYQNSVLQAMASLAYLEPHLDALSTPEALNDENLHPAVALAELFDTLNTTDGTQRTCYPPGIVQSVDNMSKGWLHNEQQDAQEFFQKLTNALEKEVTEYIKRTRVVSGLESLSGMMVNKKTQHDLSEKHLNSKIVRPEFKNPFEGLLAQRVGCLQCGYVEGVRLQAFTSLSLPLPSSIECALGECLTEFTAIERIEEVECDKCTLLAHKNKLEKIIHPQSQISTTTHGLYNSVVARLKDVCAALDEDNFTPETFKRLKVPAGKVSSTKTKQTMIARPPPILVLHINRSQYDMMSGITRKNSAALSFPVVLNIESIVTGGELEINPGLRISEGLGRRILYQLKSVIAHYGNHHNGHYICYRRTAKGMWFKISDDKVWPINVQELNHISNAFMLFYEIMTPEEEEILLEKIQRAEAMQAQSPLKGANADTLFDRDEPRYESQSDQDPEPSESLIDNSGIPLSDLPIEDPGIDDVDDELPPRSPETPQTSPEPEESPNEPSRAEEWSSPPQVVSDSQTEELNGYLRQRVQNKKRKNNPPENDNNSNDPPSSVPKSPLVLVN